MSSPFKKCSLLLINNGHPDRRNPEYVSYIRTIGECLEECGFTVKFLSFTKPAKLFHKIKSYIFLWLKIIASKYSAHDIIYINHVTHCFPAIYSTKNNKNKIIIHWHGEDLLPNNWVLKKLLTTIQGKLRELTHIVPSEYYKGILNHSLSVPTNKIHVNPSGGVETNIFSPTDNKPLPYNKLSIGYASSISKSKGFDIFLAVSQASCESLTQRNVHTEFHCIDYGPESKKYLSTPPLSSNISVHKCYDKKEIHLFYEKIDILLFPTRRKSESLGLVALEAMACGVPVIAPNKFAAPEYIYPGVSGELFEEYSTSEVLKCIEKIHANYNSYSTREVILEKYSKESTVKNYKELFAKLNNTKRS
ncbi:MAG: hypothetical protein CTR55_01470 [Pseudomonas sp.]|uniref:glycosyltransferase family 4 protein n=1 Tax=Pseudomonas sp. TaxID=306 RepID=UPI000CADF4D8|nr:glycosyltransferase family 4 protein [Pseudomonas sp.]PJI50994.1 MAG: hypothetical protein CTR55_01470 [Pseudomonas sp.]